MLNLNGNNWFLVMVIGLLNRQNIHKKNAKLLIYFQIIINLRTISTSATNTSVMRNAVHVELFLLE